ncbi:Hsp70 family protein [Phytomonospora sp. NPDC050363]|uniref:Hsp70 family protein n=1 Tax=Phytomonospora sp. NPDC050363 TaxID=3155642 RepID=UPI0033F0630E
MAESASGVRLGIDFGTSSTVAVLAREGRPIETLLFDGSPVLPSSVFAGDGKLLIGRDAERSAAADPARFEPNPKRCVGDGLVLLGDKEFPVTEVIASVLRRVVDEAVRVAGALPEVSVLTHPADWRAERLGVLRLAAKLAGLNAPRFTPEPVAAATHFTAHLGHTFPEGTDTVVYDLGGGTCDVTVVRNDGGRMQVVASGGLSDVGGLDIDEAIVDHLQRVYPDEAWRKIRSPETPSDRRHRRSLWRDVKDAKELLSRESTAALFIPLLDKDVHLTRDELQGLAAPLLDRTVALTVNVLERANVSAQNVSGLFLVGGASRMPLVSTLLLRRTGVAPTVLEQPELVVASGAVDAPTTAPPAPAPAPQDPTMFVQTVPPPPRQVIRGVAKVPVRAQPPQPPERVVHEPLPYTPTRVETDPEFLDARAEQPEEPVAPPPPPPADGDVPVRVPEGDLGAVTALALRDDRYLAVATTQGIVIAEASTGRRVTVLDGHSSTPRALAWSEDGTVLASSADGDAVQLWAQASWGWKVSQEMWRPNVLQRRLGSHSDQVRSLSWATGSIAGANINSIRVWRSYDGKLKRELTFADPNSTVVPKGVRCVAWSPDGQLLAAAGCQGLVKIWQVVGEDPTMVLRTDPLTIRQLAWSPDGRRLVFGDAGGDVRMWTIGGTKAVTLPNGHSAAVETVAWSPDGKRIASGGVDRVIRLWNAETSDPIGELTGHAGDISAVCWTADGKYLVSGSGDRTVRIWDVKKMREVR